MKKRFLTVVIGLLVLLFATTAFACNKNKQTNSDECVFEGANNFRVRANSEVDWTDGITAKSNGKEIEVVADASEVDITKAGSYKIYFTAGTSKITRTVRVYEAPAIKFNGENFASGTEAVFTYGDATSVRGLATGFTATDSFGKELEITASAPEYDGGFGTFDVTWSTRDSAGNTASVSGKVKIDDSKRPTAENADYDFSDDSVELNVGLFDANRITVYDGGNKVNLSYYEIGSDKITLSGAHFAKYGTGAHEMKLVTEYGYRDFTVNVTDSKPVNLSGVSRMDGYIFKVGEEVEIPLPKRLGEGHQVFTVSYETSGGLACTTGGGMLSFGTPSAGKYTVKVVAEKPNKTKSEKSFTFDVLDTEDYERHLAPGTANQFADRFVNLNCVKVAFEYLDETVYGVNGAYHIAINGGGSVWDQRVQLQNSYWSDVSTPLSDYTQLSFDLYLNGTCSGTDMAPFCIFSGDKYPAYRVIEKDTNTKVEVSNVTAGKWYNFSVNVPSSSNEFWIAIADANKAVDCYLRNLTLSKNYKLEMFMAHQGNVKLTDGWNIGGRENVGKYVPNGAAWDNRCQFTESAMNRWNELVNSDNGGVFRFDIYWTTEGQTGIIFFKLPGYVMLSLSSEGVSVFDMQSNVAAPDNLSTNTWYTIAIDVKTLGAIDANDNHTEFGFQFCYDCEFYMDNAEFVANT